jgi:hypothetical protein
VPGEFKSTPGDGSLRTTQDKSGRCDSDVFTLPAISNSCSVAEQQFAQKLNTGEV